MSSKIKIFLQSNFLLISTAILLGLLCRYFAVNPGKLEPFFEAKNPENSPETIVVLEL